ncbi:MAG: hypothetical protein PHQ52_01270 [Candidatus Omnitrophica bacterium]|nr:hypothetical protein [Candidatus Omnitrophota bacterium]
MALEEKIDKIKSSKWLFSPLSIIIAFLVVGPLALVLVFMSPFLTKKKKIIWAIVIIILSALLLIVTIKASKEIINYYKIVFGPMTY